MMGDRNNIQTFFIGNIGQVARPGTAKLYTKGLKEISRAGSTKEKKDLEIYQY